LSSWEPPADDLDIHVITPGGVEIYFENIEDATSGGVVDVDGIPVEFGLWVENIIFPLDGSAPKGTYTYFVVNYNQQGAAADAFALEVFLGDTLQVTQTGLLSDEKVGTQFTFNFSGEELRRGAARQLTAMHLP
jgi:uncharacterized protein YfaP (DUF2135 family)